MNMGKMMKQFKKTQKKMEKVTEELANKELEVTSGGGAVKITISGAQEILDLTIDPIAVDPEDVEMLEDLILAAINEALKDSKELYEKEMGKITGGLNIPGLF